jgi:hypothetical protein
MEKGFDKRIKQLREDLVTEIVRLLDRKGLNEIELPLPEEAGDAAWIIRYDWNGDVRENYVRRVTISDSRRNLLIYSENENEQYGYTISTEYDYDAQDPRLLAKVLELAASVPGESE